MLGLTIRDERAGRPLGRRSAPGRGAVRVTPPAPRSWPTLKLTRPSLEGAWTRIQQVMWPLLLVALGVGLYELSTRLLPLADRPISLISVQGDLQYIDRASVQEVIQPYVDDSFLSIDLAGLRTDLVDMSWVASASVKRVWPDQLIIHLDEQLPVARWGGSTLLNNEGMAFEPGDMSRFEDLPRLDGPQRAKRRVMRNYQQFNRLLRSYGHGISRLELRDRGSWFLTTQDGIEILLGRDDVVDKMQRFLTVDQLMLSERRQQIERVDLRYSNGMAVAWREPPAEAQSGE
ncbi:cell division protein FtsQ [Halopseudomonas xinjiangensis]|uniref:Cell division protein FtsQ n=1 Tax=Halopseudomonas xinjiangensis TaxID=487184 RepID=A0A1H1LR03_9GAMM|nr:cell division protein FtsQ/DivIB [Halopseudomonas xinjiangensis]SDR76752.1 cell division protein FtsQ [Halopseudomonas xinjiangensis]